MKEIKDLINFGLINIDKSSGPTSYLVSEYLKRSLQLNKTSHMGTLDPKVTGVLPITLGRACKLASYFITHDKTYIGVMHTHKECNMKDLQKLIDENFTGKIKQTPPRKSAVKIQERIREVYSFKFSEAFEMFDKSPLPTETTSEEGGLSVPAGDAEQEGKEEKSIPRITETTDSGEIIRGTVNEEGDGQYFLFECKVEGGTYIRKICSDLGEMIGGANMTELRRTEAGIFSEDTIVSLENFDSAVGVWKAGDESKLMEMIMPAEDALEKIMPILQVDKSAVRALRTGAKLLESNVLDKEKLGTEEVFALFLGKEFIGIYRRSKEYGIFARSEFVFD